MAKDKSWLLYSNGAEAMRPKKVFEIQPRDLAKLLSPVEFIEMCRVLDVMAQEQVRFNVIKIEREPNNVRVLIAMAGALYWYDQQKGRREMRRFQSQLSSINTGEVA